MSEQAQQLWREIGKPEAAQPSPEQLLSFMQLCDDDDGVELARQMLQSSNDAHRCWAEQHACTTRAGDEVGSGPYWFADWDSENAVGQYGWAPFLETREGLIPGIDVWFSTKLICEDWIRKHIIGAILETE